MGGRDYTGAGAFTTIRRLISPTEEAIVPGLKPYWSLQFGSQSWSRFLVSYPLHETSKFALLTCR
jgi:hypothetical protein